MNEVIACYQKVYQKRDSILNNKLYMCTESLIIVHHIARVNYASFGVKAKHKEAMLMKWCLIC